MEVIFKSKVGDIVKEDNVFYVLSPQGKKTSGTLTQCRTLIKMLKILGGVK